MNDILINNEFHQELITNCRNVKAQILFKSAFIKYNSLKLISDSIHPKIAVDVVSRWRLCDLISGVSDLEVYELCKDHGWKFGINLSLHAKVYVFDNKLVLLGSGNLTNSGLGISLKPNDEVGILTQVTLRGLEKLQIMTNAVTWLDDELYCELSDLVSFHNEKKALETDNLVWPEHIMKHFDHEINEIWISDLPDSDFETYISEGVSPKELKKKFEESVVYRWIIQNIKKEEGYTNFGWLTNKLHDVLMDDPTPYRRQIKDYVMLIFDLIEKLDLSNITVIKHRHTSSLLLK